MKLEELNKKNYYHEFKGVKFHYHDNGTAVSTACVSIPNGAHFNIRKDNAEEVIPWLCQEIQEIYKAVPAAETKINDFYGISRFRELGKRIFAEKYPGYGDKFSNAFWTAVHVSDFMD